MILLVVMALVGLGIWKNPTTIAVGVGIFIAGIPAYFIIYLLKKSSCSAVVLKAFSDFTQKMLLVVPESGNVEPEFEAQIKDYQPPSFGTKSSQ